MGTIVQRTTYVYDLRVHVHVACRSIHKMTRNWMHVCACLKISELAGTMRHCTGIPRAKHPSMRWFEKMVCLQRPAELREALNLVLRLLGRESRSLCARCAQRKRLAVRRRTRSEAEGGASRSSRYTHLRAGAPLPSRNGLALALFCVWMSGLLLGAQ